MDKVKKVYTTTDEYTKEQLHEAYSVEYHAHKKTQEYAKRLERKLAELRYVLNNDTIMKKE